MLTPRQIETIDDCLETSVANLVVLLGPECTITVLNEMTALPDTNPIDYDNLSTMLGAIPQSNHRLFFQMMMYLHSLCKEHECEINTEEQRIDIFPNRCPLKLDLQGSITAGDIRKYTLEALGVIIRIIQHELEANQSPSTFGYIVSESYKGVWISIKGTVDTFIHPIDTAMGIYKTVRHPITAVTQIANFAYAHPIQFGMSMATGYVINFGFSKAFNAALPSKPKGADIAIESAKNTVVVAEETAKQLQNELGIAQATLQASKHPLPGMGIRGLNFKYPPVEGIPIEVAREQLRAASQAYESARAVQTAANEIFDQAAQAIQDSRLARENANMVEMQLRAAQTVGGTANILDATQVQLRTRYFGLFRENLSRHHTQNVMSEENVVEVGL